MSKGNGSFKLHRDGNKYQNRDGQWAEKGTLVPGTYHPGRTPVGLIIGVQKGELFINGTRYFPRGGSCLINAGQDVTIEVKEPSEYHCWYK